MERASSSRFESIDLLRGFIMMLMAIDHASYFIGQTRYQGGEFWTGSFPSYSEATPFLMRYVTHLCAPGFIFLMGMGMSIFYSKRINAGWSQKECFFYYAKRGLILIAIQFLVENVFWVAGHPDSVFIQFSILSLFGFLMILCAFCMQLSSRALIALAVIAETSVILLAQYTSSNQPLSLIWHVLFLPARLEKVEVYYAIVPWIPTAFLGIVCGRLLQKHGASFMQKLPLIGGSLLMCSVLIRLFSYQYGNIRPIEINNWITFLLTTKYPPSLFFLTLTGGVLCLLFYVFEMVSARSVPFILKPLSILGKSALFFYVLHIPLYFVLGFFAHNRDALPSGVFIGWACGLLILTPLTWAYVKFKNTRPPESLWRMF